MAYQSENIFAKILNGDLPAHKVYEDEHTLAFMDIMPQSKGHTLVIPRVGAENLFDLPEDALRHLIAATQKVARGVKAAVEAPGIMVMQLNGAEAGQSVFHIHFHIVPRWNGIDLDLHARQKADPDELAALAGKIAAAI